MKSWKYEGESSLPKLRIVELGQNTEKSPGDLRRLAVFSDCSEKPSANAGVKNLPETIFYKYGLTNNLNISNRIFQVDSLSHFPSRLGL